MTEANLAETMWQARKVTGLTMAEVHERTLIPVRSIQNWERGERTPPPYVSRWYLKELDEIRTEQKEAGIEPPTKRRGRPSKR